jgi:resuscitation-promoting factor RpfA
MSKSADAFRTISEVADVLATPAHVLRFWESKFTQIKPVKRAGGRRYYRPADVALLGGIKQLLHEDGLTIRGVQKILKDQGVKHVSALARLPDEDADDAVFSAAEGAVMPAVRADAPATPEAEPDAPEPETPAPETPEPETPEPDAPEPEAPEPETPEPEVPQPAPATPDFPAPFQPEPVFPEPVIPAPEPLSPPTPVEIPTGFPSEIPDDPQWNSTPEQPYDMPYAQGHSAPQADVAGDSPATATPHETAPADAGLTPAADPGMAQGTETAAAIPESSQDSLGAPPPATDLGGLLTDTAPPSKPAATPEAPRRAAPRPRTDATAQPDLFGFAAPEASDSEIPRLAARLRAAEGKVLSARERAEIGAIKTRLEALHRRLGGEG